MIRHSIAHFKDLLWIQTSHKILKTQKILRSDPSKPRSCPAPFPTASVSKTLATRISQKRLCPKTQNFLFHLSVRPRVFAVKK